MAPAIPYSRGFVTVGLIVAVAALAGCACDKGAKPAAGSAGRAQQPSPPAAQPAEARHALAYPTGQQSTSVLLVEKLQPAEVRLNRPYEYQIRVTNLTDRPLSGVVLTEQVPGNFQIASAGPATQPGAPATRPAAAAEGGPRFDLGEMKPHEIRTLSIRGTPTAPGSLDTCTSITYNPALCVSASVVNPILRLSKSGPQRADICEPIVWNYSIRNEGTGTEHNVRIEDRLPEGLVTEDGKNELSLNIGDLPAGQSKDVPVRLKAQRTGEFSSSAVAHSDGDDVKSDAVATAVGAPKLEVRVQGPEEEYVGKPLVYRVTVRNTGDSPARDLDLDFTGIDRPQVAMIAEDEQPRMLSIREGPESGVGALEPGQSRTFEITARPEQPGDIRLSASASAVCAEKATASAQTAIRALSALLLEVVDQDDPIRVGSNVVYMITVKNQGSGPDNDVRITAKLPDGESYVSSDGPTKPTVEGQTLRFEPVQTLPPGQTVTWKVEAKADRAADVRFGVQLDSRGLGDKPAMETEPTRLY